MRMGDDEAGLTFEGKEDPECKVIFPLGRRIDMTKQTEIIVVLYHLR